MWSDIWNIWNVCLNCVHNCDDHSSLDFKIRSSIYETFHISLHMTLFLLSKGVTSLSIHSKENTLIFPLCWNSYAMCFWYLTATNTQTNYIARWEVEKKSFSKSSQWFSLTSIAIHLPCLQNPTWALLIEQSPKHWQRKKHEQHPTQCFYILNKLYVISITCPVHPVCLLLSLQYKLINIICECDDCEENRKIIMMITKLKWLYCILVW